LLVALANALPERLSASPSFSLLQGFNSRLKQAAIGVPLETQTWAIIRIDMMASAPVKNPIVAVSPRTSLMLGHWVEMLPPPSVLSHRGSGLQSGRAHAGSSLRLGALR
jgi:hypothetical protein